MSPMQRSLAYLRDDGWTAETVERWIPRANIRRDLFGVGDILAVKSGEKPIIVQSTTGDNYAARMAKIEASPLLPLLSEHFRIILHGWAKRKVKRGGKAIRYELREAEFTAEQLETKELSEAVAC